MIGLPNCFHIYGIKVLLLMCYTWVIFSEDPLLPISDLSPLVLSLFFCWSIVDHKPVLFRWRKQLSRSHEHPSNISFHFVLTHLVVRGEKLWVTWKFPGKAWRIHEMLFSVMIQYHLEHDSIGHKAAFFLLIILRAMIQPLSRNLKC